MDFRFVLIAQESHLPYTFDFFDLEPDEDLSI